MKISKNKISQLRRIFVKQQNVVAVYVYGSRIKGYAGSRSDLDIALVIDALDKVNYQYLYLAVSQVFKDLDIDLRIVTFSSSPTYLLQVLKSGECVYEKSAKQRVNFETKVLKDFYDTQHIRDIYDHYLKQSFAR